jgi:hypothetical protein
MENEKKQAAPSPETSREPQFYAGISPDYLVEYFFNDTMKRHPVPMQKEILRRLFEGERPTKLHNEKATVTETWISVTDKMPQRFTDILVYDTVEGRCTARVDQWGRFVGDNFAEESCGDVIYENVTHWMPLPAPPSPEATLPVQVTCPICNGDGRRYVTREMAIDAGDRALEGQEDNCGNCGGDGWVVEEATKVEMLEVLRDVVERGHDSLAMLGIRKRAEQLIGELENRVVDVCPLRVAERALDASPNSVKCGLCGNVHGEAAHHGL